MTYLQNTGTGYNSDSSGLILLEMTYLQNSYFCWAEALKGLILLEMKYLQNKTDSLVVVFCFKVLNEIALFYVYINYIVKAVALKGFIYYNIFVS